MKNCPYCEAELSDTARKCKHCGEWVDKEKSAKSYTVDDSNKKSNQEDTDIKTPQKTKSKNKRVIITTIIAIILGFLMFVGYSIISNFLLVKKWITYDLLKQADIEEIGDMLSGYYNKFGTLPGLGIEDMVPINTYSQEIEDKLGVSIPMRSEDKKSYLGITNKLILSGEYGYYPTQEGNIISFVLMTKTDTDFGSNYIYDSSISNDKPKICNTVSKGEIFGRDVNDNCIYTDEEQLRYIYVGQYVKEEEKKEESNNKPSNKKTDKGTSNKTQTKQQPVQYQPDEYEAWKQRTEEYKNTHPNETRSQRYDEATATPEERKAHEEYYAVQGTPLPITL